MKFYFPIHLIVLGLLITLSACDDEEPEPVVLPCSTYGCNGNGTGQTDGDGGCECSCDAYWGGESCETCIIDSSHCSENEVPNVATCECDCSEDWCGPDCDEPVFDCVNGDWVDAFCACSCDPGWFGTDCSESTGWFNFDIYLVENGQEQLVDSVRFTGVNGLVINSPSTPPSIGLDVTGSNGFSLNIDIHQTNELVSATTFSINQTLGVETDFTYQDYDNPTFAGTAYSGTFGTLLINGDEFNAYFDCYLVSNLSDEDTIHLANGTIHRPL